MSLHGIVAALSLDGGINGDVFKYFVEYILVPNTILGDMCMISIARTVSWSSILQSKIGNL